VQSIKKQQEVLRAKSQSVVKYIYTCTSEYTK